MMPVSAAKAAATGIIMKYVYGPSAGKYLMTAVPTITPEYAPIA